MVQVPKHSSEKLETDQLVNEENHWPKEMISTVSFGGALFILVKELVNSEGVSF